MRICAIYHCQRDGRSSRVTNDIVSVQDATEKLFKRDNSCSYMAVTAQLCMLRKIIAKLRRKQKNTSVDVNAFNESEKKEFEQADTK